MDGRGEPPIEEHTSRGGEESFKWRRYVQSRYGLVVSSLRHKYLNGQSPVTQTLETENDPILTPSRGSIVVGVFLFMPPTASPYLCICLELCRFVSLHFLSSLSLLTPLPLSLFPISLCLYAYLFHRPFLCLSLSISLSTSPCCLCPSVCISVCIIIALTNTQTHIGLHARRGAIHEEPNNIYSK